MSDAGLTGAELDRLFGALQDTPPRDIDLAVVAVQEIVAARLAALGLTEEWKHANARGGGAITRTRGEAERAEAEWEERIRTKHPTEPPPPASLGIFRRYVTAWVSAPTFDRP